MSSAGLNDCSRARLRPSSGYTRLDGRTRTAADRRAGRPAQRRQIHALQPHHRHAPVHRGARSPGTTRDVLAAPAAWQDRTFTLVDTGGLFGATTDPLHELVVEHGLKALETPTSSCSSLDAREGLVPGDEEIAAARFTCSGGPSCSPSTRRTTSAARSRAIEFYRMGFEPALEVVGRARRRRLRAARRGRRPAAGAQAAPRTRRSRRDRRGDRRPAERGEVVAGQSAAARRAGDGERDARAPRATRSTSLLQWHKRQLPDRRHRRHAAAGTGRARRARSKP